MSQIQQKSWEAVKRLDRLAPNLAHICRSIWEWIYVKQIAPRDTRGGHLGGFRGQTFKSLGRLSNGWTDWHYTSADSSGNGHRVLGSNYNSPHNTPGAFRGVLGGHKFKCLGKLSNGWTDWHKIWYKSADSSGNRHRLNTIRPSIPQWVLGGHKFKSLGKLSNSWTDWHQIWYTSADSSGNGHRLNTICPSISQGAFWGVLGGHKLKVC